MLQTELQVSTESEAAARFEEHFNVALLTLFSCCVSVMILGIMLTENTMAWALIGRPPNPFTQGDSAVILLREPCLHFLQL